jgi:hypothetical protein
MTLCPVVIQNKLISAKDIQLPQQIVTAVENNYDPTCCQKDFSLVFLSASKQHYL